MSVIFLILKIIGLILLAALLLFVLAVVLVLFVPVRYHVRGSIEEQVTVQGRISWLLSILTYHISYENEVSDSYLRTLGIRRKKKKQLSEDEVAEDLEELESEMDEASPEDFKQAEAETEADTSVDIKPEAITEVRASEKSKHQPSGSIFKKLSDRISEIKQKIKVFWDNLRNIFHKVSDIKRMVVDETNKKAVLHVLSELKYLLTHFRFRKIDTDLRFSLGDPALTGQALGVISMMPFLYQYRFRVYPDFEAEDGYIRGTFEIKGRIRLIHVVVSIVRLLKKQEIRIVLKRIMKGRL